MTPIYLNYYSFNVLQTFHQQYYFGASISELLIFQGNYIYELFDNNNSLLEALY